MNSITPIPAPRRDIFDKDNLDIYIKYIVIAVIVTSILNLIHSLFVLRLDLSMSLFYVPVVAGIIFGLLIGKVQVISNLHAKMAATDALTKIYNRHIFSSIMDSEVHRATRYDRPFSLIMFDIDHFKKVNDTYGHLVGDLVLQTIADMVTELNRDSDIFARIGGEEFVILSTETDIKGAQRHAERLRVAIEEHDFDTAGTVTCSFGVAEFQPKKDKANTLIKRADDALYRAKKRGRNRVELE